MNLNPSSFTILSGGSIYCDYPVALSAYNPAAFDLIRHIWYFGNEQYSYERDPTVVYDRPGVYQLTHTVCDSRGKTHTTTATITAKEFVKEAVTITPTLSACYASTPFTLLVSVTSTNPVAQTVALYSQNSQSAPPRSGTHYWDHLVPRWGFYVNQQREIPSQTVTIDTQPVYLNGIRVAYVGTACVDYIDDLPGTVVLWATSQSVSGDVINSHVVANSSVVVKAIAPTHITITRDGKRPLHTQYYAGSVIPFVVTINGTVSGAPVILHYLADQASITGNFNCYGITSLTATSSVLISASNIHCLPVGGFYRGAVTSCASSQMVTLSSQLSVLYSTSVLSASSWTLSANSPNFSILPLADVHHFRVGNEDFDMAAMIADHLPRQFTDRAPVFFKTLLPAILGDALSGTDQSLGIKIYERIANFTSNMGDVDTCTIDRLIDKANMTDVPIDDFALTLPAEIRRILDRASISYNRLWGTGCFCNTNFTNCETCCGGNPCTLCGKQKTSNLGALLSCETATVSAGDKLVYRSKQKAVYRMVTVQASGSATSFALSSFNQGGLTDSPCQYYDFYRYTDTVSNNAVESVIDWNNCKTTVNRSTSAHQWLQQNGTLEMIILYYLLNGLGATDPACAITIPTPCFTDPCIADR